MRVLTDMPNFLSLLRKNSYSLGSQLPGPGNLLSVGGLIVVVETERCLDETQNGGIACKLKIELH